MELVLFILLLTILGILCYWLLGNLYSLMRTPAVYFPMSLALKMTLVTIVGAPLAGVGGIVLAILVFNHAFSKRDDYHQIREILAGTIISILASVAIFLMTFYLAWAVMG